ncbi:hypothetical protein SY88_06010 [Clostridiales bacterium PH28_bin88]|nr:hypothetical protein SY88_06010 [Clostridiales bacterium PH28_bin88]
MNLWPVLLFSLAVSIDGLGVGLSYGMRRILVPWHSLLVICVTSTVAITVSMFFGHLVAGLIPPGVAEKLGALIMVAVGCWIILEARIKGRNHVEEAACGEYSLLKVKIRPLGIVIQILREPVQADFDRSGTINPREALALGLALAMDALGAGFGAAVAGMELWLVPVFVGLCKLALVSGGLKLGARVGEHWLGNAGSLVPGAIILILGLLKI